MNRLFFLSIYFIGAFLLFSASLRAQESTARIYGIVTDEDGAVVPDAFIYMNGRTNSESANRFFLASATNNKGEYSMENLPAGEHSVKVQSSMSGMTYQNNNITLREGQKLKLDIQICYGGCSEGEFDVRPAEITDADKKEIINWILEDYFINESISDQSSSVKKKRKIVLSLKNIKAEWIKALPNVKFKLVSESEIRKETKKDFLFYVFTEIKPAKRGIVVLMENTFSVSRQSGAGSYYLFQKKPGKWVGQSLGGWVS